MIAVASDQLEALADLIAHRVLELLEERQGAPKAGELVDAQAVARLLGISRTTVYEHAVDLGADARWGLGRGRGCGSMSTRHVRRGLVASEARSPRRRISRHRRPFPAGADRRLPDLMSTSCPFAGLGRRRRRWVRDAVSTTASRSVDPTSAAADRRRSPRSCAGADVWSSARGGGRPRDGPHDAPTERRGCERVGGTDSRDDATGESRPGSVKPNRRGSQCAGGTGR